MTTKRDGAAHVLVVDDSPTFLAAAAAWVQSQPSMRLVGTVSSGSDAVTAVTRLAPDLVLMDVFMPEMDGFEATREIKSLPGAPIVILLSVSDDSAVEDEARAAGADRFLPKPEFASQLPGLIRELLGRRPALESSETS